MGKVKKKIIGILKTNKYLYKLYYYLGTLFVNLLKLFVRPQDNLILFVSYGGKQYSDSPKVIYEAMCQDERFKDFDFVWAFQDPKAFHVPGNAKVIRIDTLKYYLMSLKARCWVTNVVVERTLKYSGKNTFYFCTWHGTPIKTLGEDISTTTFYNHVKYNFDVMLAQGDFDAEVFKKAFRLDGDKVKTLGLPRNDILISTNQQDQIRMKEKIGIPINRKVILYAPTYRDGQGYVMNKAINFKKWNEILGDEYVILFRAHSAVLKLMNIDTDFSFVYNVSDYPELNDLMIASDILVSDYSSIFFDYSILEKPMYCFAYDYDEYCTSRGVYFDIRKEVMGGSISEDELLDLIQNGKPQEVIEKTLKFRNKFVTNYGDATSKSIDLIYSEIN